MNILGLHLLRQVFGRFFCVTAILPLFLLTLLETASWNICFYRPHSDLIISKITPKYHNMIKFDYWTSVLISDQSSYDDNDNFMTKVLSRWTLASDLCIFGPFTPVYKRYTNSRIKQSGTHTQTDWGIALMPRVIYIYHKVMV